MLFTIAEAFFCSWLAFSCAGLAGAVGATWANVVMKKQANIRPVVILSKAFFIATTFVELWVAE